MAYEMRDGSGTIFKNKYHEDGDSKPPYKGAIMWRGEKIEVALWVKEGQQGKFFSVKLQEPREKETRPQEQAKPVIPMSQRLSRVDMDDEIPF